MFWPNISEIRKNKKFEMIKNHREQRQVHTWWAWGMHLEPHIKENSNGEESDKRKNSSSSTSRLCMVGSLCRWQLFRKWSRYVLLTWLPGWLAVWCDWYGVISLIEASDNPAVPDPSLPSLSHHHHGGWTVEKKSDLWWQSNTVMCYMDTKPFMEHQDDHGCETDDTLG